MFRVARNKCSNVNSHSLFIVVHMNTMSLYILYSDNLGVYMLCFIFQKKIVGRVRLQTLYNRIRKFIKEMDASISRPS